MASQIDHHFVPLSRSLTLDELQTHLHGKPLGSMSLDDLLKNVCPSTCSAAPTFTNKTVDQVWTDIQHAQGNTSLGQMTLEDFFLKAGITATHSNWMHYPGPQMPVSSPPLMPALSPPRKRLASGDFVHKTVDRRQKRMIKNRESAARSRARKQAYTNELENKVSRLEQENASLKEQRKKEILLPYVLPPPEPVVQLRRTSSARF